MNDSIKHSGLFFVRYAALALGWDSSLLVAYASSISPIKRGLALAASLRERLAGRASVPSDAYGIASFANRDIGVGVAYFVNPLVWPNPAICRQNVFARLLTQSELLEEVEWDRKGLEFFETLRGWAVLHKFRVVKEGHGFQAQRGSVLLHLESTQTCYKAYVTLGRLFYKNPRLGVCFNLDQGVLKVRKWVEDGNDGWKVPSFMDDKNVPNPTRQPAEQVIGLLRLMRQVPNPD